MGNVFIFKTTWLLKSQKKIVKTYYKKLDYSPKCENKQALGNENYFIIIHCDSFWYRTDESWVTRFTFPLVPYPHADTWSGSSN